MEIIACLVFLCTFILAYALGVRYYAHMFQLDSYAPVTFFKWLSRGGGAPVITKSFSALIALVLLAFLPRTAGLFAAAVCHLLYAFAFRPFKAKKPFVVTMRALRLLITTGILGAALFAVFAVLRLPLLAELILLCAPFLLLLASLINAPVENAVKRHYINDAKAILAARRKNLTVIGITGSYGKTSTKFFLQKILSQKYNVLMTPGSYNTTMGVVRVIREMLKPSHEIFICEMGARHLGDVKEICDIVLPDHGILTSVGPQHLETFGSIENVVKAKFELADAVPEKGFMVLNADNRYIDEHPFDKTAVRYGIDNENAEYRAKDVTLSPRGVSFTVVHGEESFPLSTRLVGRHNVMNILACAALADKLGLTKEEIAAGVRKLEPVPHRLQMIDAGDITIIDDAFNANPAGTKAALEVLGAFDGVKILVTPGMVELGDSADLLNREFGRAAAGVCDYIFIVGKENRDSIAKGIAETGFDTEKRVKNVSGPTEAMDLVKALDTGAKKIVLLENDLPDNFA